ncbi:uncharacterized protein [Nerophis lumbriciformis]|uniref:uncharacterized protein n=1 Tax=Nerophis lumbriciformis TaxID=546530 RepID=UPI002ADF6CB6|nr:nestin-like [Nerophis lumbriciformis]
MELNNLVDMTSTHSPFIVGTISIITFLIVIHILKIIFTIMSDGSIIPSWMKIYLPSFYHRLATDNLKKIESLQKQHLDKMKTLEKHLNNQIAKTANNEKEIKTLKGRLDNQIAETAKNKKEIETLENHLDTMKTLEKERLDMIKTLEEERLDKIKTLEGRLDNKIAEAANNKKEIETLKERLDKTLEDERLDKMKTLEEKRLDKKKTLEERLDKMKYLEEHLEKMKNLEERLDRKTLEKERLDTMKNLEKECLDKMKTLEDRPDNQIAETAKNKKEIETLEKRLEMMKTLEERRDKMKTLEECLANQIAEAAHNKKEMETLEERLDKMKTLEEERQDKMKTLEEERLDKMKSLQESCNQITEAAHNKLEMEDLVKVLDLDHFLTPLVDMVKTLEERLDKNAAEEANAVVVFSAGLEGRAGTTKASNGDQILVYNKMVINVGGGYDDSTGIFKVPIKGLYFVTFTCGKCYNYNMGAWVTKNNHDKLICVFDDNNGNSRITNSIVVEMEVGDDLRVFLENGHTILTTCIRTTFSVFLIKRM